MKPTVFNTELELIKYLRDDPGVSSQFNALFDLGVTRKMDKTLERHQDTGILAFFVMQSGIYRIFDQYSMRWAWTGLAQAIPQENKRSKSAFWHHSTLRYVVNQLSGEAMPYVLQFATDYLLRDVSVADAAAAMIKRIVDERFAYVMRNKSAMSDYSPTPKIMIDFAVSNEDRYDYHPTLAETAKFEADRLVVAKALAAEQKATADRIRENARIREHQREVVALQKQFDELQDLIAMGEDYGTW